MKTGYVLSLATVVATLLGVPAIADDAVPVCEAAAVEAIVDEAPDYDSWKPFNKRNFSFNYDVGDRYVMKPVARAWDRVLPDEVQHAVARFFDNVATPIRFVNDRLQARPREGGEQVALFANNSTGGDTAAKDRGADRLRALASR